MLFLKRAVTALVLFCILAVVFNVLTSGIMGGIAGARAVTEQHITGPDAFAVGKLAGLEVHRTYGALILLCSAGVSAVVSCALAFGGAFPWCRQPLPPPPLPSRFG